ncbi:MAG TPA: DoxX family protein [Opitutaceae bacterium]|nr:DoxX family protein [Opitutaceae bacterium]
MKFQSTYQRFASAANFLQPLVLLVLRVYWGWQFAQTGWGKLTHLERTAQYFDSLHIPAPTFSAIATGSTELIGGALLVVGLLSRFAGLALGTVMVVAFLTTETEAVHNLFNDPDKFTGATPFLFLLVSVIILAFGPGSLSLDRFVFGAANKPAK